MGSGWRRYAPCYNRDRNMENEMARVTEHIENPHRTVLNLRLRLFASYREKAGASELDIELPDGATVGALAKEVGRRFPDLTPAPERLVVAVNYEYRDHDHNLVDGDEVALIPPVSGGQGVMPEAGMVAVTEDRLDPDAITDAVRRDTNGAVVTFAGTTRSVTGDREVLYLEYEAYLPMARKKLEEVAAELRERWDVDIALAHRLGRLEIGETSLVVAVASRHRRDAFDACQHGIDRIKTTVPIWKKEFFVGGEVWVESPEDHALKSATDA